jgi:citrate lyase beta subunit
MMSRFSLLLFATDPAFIERAMAAGVDGIIVDWEHLGKESRQAGADTQVNHDTLDDLRRVRACTIGQVLCRVNNHPEVTAGEVEVAIDAGADEILLPMVRTVDEVNRVLDKAAGRCRVGILVETLAATRIAAELARLPLSRLYVGLNDLGIERHTPNIFVSATDGTVERVRAFFSCSFGFGGLTLPDRGFPIPCRLLIGEMARLACDFGFLRRSFCRDIQGRDIMVEVARLRTALDAAWNRTEEIIARDQSELARVVAAWSINPLEVRPDE